MTVVDIDEEVGLLSEALLHAPPTPEETARSRQVVAGFLVLIGMIGGPILIGLLYMKGVIRF